MKTQIATVVGTCALMLGASAAQAESEANAGYKGGFFIDDGGVNKLVIQGRVQGMFEAESAEAGDDRELSTAFSIPRARLTLKGTAYTDALSYKFQSDFGKGSVALKDFLVDYRLGSGSVHVRFGQFKMPFARQQLTSSSKLEFVDRSIVDKAFGNGRDIGVAIHNRFEKSPDFEWVVGVFNGTGDKGRFSGDVAVDPTTGEGSVSGGSFSNVPDDVRPAVVFRTGYNHGGIKGYSEADLEGGEFRYSVGLAAMMHFSGGANPAAARVGFDAVAKAQGFSTTGGVYAAADGEKEDDLSYTSVGAYLQLGYVIADSWQPALRYAHIARDGGATTQEASFAFSKYAFGHGFKWQSDVSLLREDASGSFTNDIRARSQVQLSF